MNKLTSRQGEILELIQDHMDKTGSPPTRAEIAKLHAQRDMYEETMKKAFMRGVCALNLEAMTMFGKDADDEGNAQGSVPVRQTLRGIV